LKRIPQVDDEWVINLIPHQRRITLAMNMTHLF
jgi:hypothetical protein